MLRTLRIAVVAAICGLVVILALGFRQDPHDVRSALIGDPAPAFTLPALEGGDMIALDAYRGKVVVVNFFASWCVPCKQEHAALASAWDRYRTTDVVLIGVLYQDRAEDGLTFVRKYGGGWPSAIDEDGRTALSFGVFGIPETFFIDADGVIAGRHVGPIDEMQLNTAIDALRAQAATR